MKKKLLFVFIAAFVIVCGCGDSGDDNTVVVDVTSHANESDDKESETVATEAVANEGTEVAPEINRAIMEFNKDQMALLTLLMPGDGKEFSIGDMADFCLLNLLMYHDAAETLAFAPEVEITEGKTPVYLTFEDISVGETVECRRVKTTEMEKFLSSIYGGTFAIPKGTNIADAAEFTNIDGYVAEWGYSYITALEGAYKTIENSSTRNVSDGNIELTTVGKYEEPEYMSDYTLTTVWGPNADSLFGWSLVSWEMNINEPELQQAGNNDTGNAKFNKEYHAHNVEAEVAQIRSWYYDESQRKEVLKDDGSKYRRLYYYHSGELFFAQIYTSDLSEDYRLYFNGQDLIRYIPTEGGNYDYNVYDGNIPIPDYLIDYVISDTNYW